MRWTSPPGQRASGVPSLAMADPARRKRADGERRRERIIQAAPDPIAPRGFAGTAVDEIREAAGVTGPGGFPPFGPQSPPWQTGVERLPPPRAQPGPGRRGGP